MKKELSYLEKLEIIDFSKKKVESQLEKRLELIKIPCPLFVKTSSGLQDALNGVEKPVSFKKDDEELEIVHSLAKWKREALGKYAFPLHKGIYTDMKAIRKDEIIDDIHSIYVEQWDWEKVISKEDRTIEYLKETVRSVYKSIRQSAISLKEKYHYLEIDLPKTIFFITSQELEYLYPDKSPKEREQIITKEKKAVFIISIGDKLKSGIEHDLRSPDYDDWSLNGDLIIYFKELEKGVEVSSMGIRVDEKSLKDQLIKTKTTKRLELPFHKKIIKKELPYTIGGGIGISRILMLFLGAKHISEIQASSWSNKLLKEYKTL